MAPLDHRAPAHVRCDDELPLDRPALLDDLGETAAEGGIEAPKDGLGELRPAAQEVGQVANVDRERPRVLEGERRVLPQGVR